MSDEVRAVVTSGKSLLGGEIDIKDTGIVPAFVDVVTEHRHNSGIVYLSFGCTSKDGDNRGEVLLTHRLRMSLVMAQSLRDTLSNLIGDAMKPVDKSQAN